MNGPALDVTIRPEKLADRAGISAVHVESFETPAEARLVNALRTCGELAVSLVAVVDGKVAGHIAFSPVELAFGSDIPGEPRVPLTGAALKGVGLAPLATAEPYRRRGIGAALVSHGLAACSEAGYGFVVVLGDPKYYARFGFRPARKWRLTCRFGGGDAFQALEIVPAALPSGPAEVRYSGVFAALDD